MQISEDAQKVRVECDRKNYEKARYCTIFPQYIDANLTPKEGRRIGKEWCVENPDIREILIAVHTLGYKDLFIQRGKSLPCLQGSDKFSMVPRDCLKIAIKEPIDQHYIKKSEFDRQTRNPVIEDIPNKQVFLKRVAAVIKEREGPRPEMPSVATLMNTIANQPKTKGGKQ